MCQWMVESSSTLWFFPKVLTLWSQRLLSRTPSSFLSKTGPGNWVNPFNDRKELGVKGVLIVLLQPGLPEIYEETKNHPFSRPQSMCPKI